MSDKEALARVKIDKLLEESGWRLLDDNQKRKNVVLEQGYRYDKKTKFTDYLLLDAYSRPLAVIRHKVNDKWLKRRLAISHRKVGKLFDGLLASFGGESELLERDFTNRLQEIEKEIEQEREAQGNVEEQLKINSKWTWGK